MGLERVREHRDIFDVVQIPVFGKKRTHDGPCARARPRRGLDKAVVACFRKTTTIATVPIDQAPQAINYASNAERASTLGVALVTAPTTAC